MSLLAVAAGSTSTVLDYLPLVGTVLSPVGVIILLLTRKLHTHGEVERLEQESDAKTTALADARQQLVLMQQGLTDKAIPALTLATRVLENMQRGGP